MTVTTSTTAKGAHRSEDTATGAWWEIADVRTPDGYATNCQVAIGYVGAKPESPNQYMVMASGNGAPVSSWFATEGEAREQARTYWRAIVAELAAPAPVGRAPESSPVNPPRRSVHATGAKVTEPGMYRHEGIVYRVVRSKSSTNLYAKRLEIELGSDGRVAKDTRPSFVYAQGAMAWLRATDRMSDEELAELGQATGVCQDCGSLLTHPESVARGRGPVCSGEGYSTKRK